MRSIRPWLVVAAWLEIFHASCGAAPPSFRVPFAETTVRFDYRLPVPMPPRARVLLLVPGYNGSGADMLTPSWSRFADARGLVLLAPTFQTSPEELAREEGYYYPRLGSGKTVEKALAALAQRTGVRADHIFIFGFSAGAHFAQGFARWKPERVEAFVADSAAWWKAPTSAMARVPALIMCGEEDPRLPATREFFEQGLARNAPWIWRSYRGVGHELSPAMLATAQAFFEGRMRKETGSPCYGDIQTYEVSAEPESIPEAVRVRLPSWQFAEVWKREN